jgi:cell fate (sporulation/competence/biofilm development) regulator YlbF (YheA/YmcA/DUF963 family)
VKAVIIKNTSRYPDNAVKWLLNFSARYVCSEMERMGDAALWHRYGFYVEFKNKQHAAFSGLYHCCLVNKMGGYPCATDERFRKVLVKVGTPERFPIVGLSDNRYKDKDAVPVGDFKDWQECAVAIAAHEFAHVKYSGKKDGEVNCDTIMHDAVDAFRRDREKFEAAMSAGVRAIEERQVALAAKRSPQAVNATNTVKALRKLEQWLRKRKLAETKVKHYSRLVKRLENRQAKLVGIGVAK